MAEDFGGPRREFFSLILPAIQEKYFDPLKNCLEKDYETVGKIFGKHPYLAQNKVRVN